jgi:hypothetical protein
MPLLTYADTQASAKSDSSLRVYDLIGQRIKDVTRPMPPPPNLPLSTSERVTIDEWLAQNAPPGVEPAACEPADASADASGPMVGPEYLPCAASEQRSFIAHGVDVDSKFRVPEDGANLYMCFSWRSPFASPMWANAFAPVISDARVLHHMALYQTATPQIDGALGPCSMPLDSALLAGWAPGRQNQVEPPDVGIELPTADQWLILEVHYHNAVRYTDASDASGIAFCATSQPPPHIARPSVVGSANIAIPPRATDYPVVGVCRPTISQTLHVIDATPHMHLLGTSLRTEILRGGDSMRAETLIEVPTWDFDNQVVYRVDAEIDPGDTLRTTCRYTNTTNRTVYTGSRSEDEMCGNTLVVWPAPGLTNAGDSTGRSCMGDP